MTFFKRLWFNFGLFLVASTFLCIIGAVGVLHDYHEDMLNDPQLFDLNAFRGMPTSPMGFVRLLLTGCVGLGIIGAIMMMTGDLLFNGLARTWHQIAFLVRSIKGVRVKVPAVFARGGQQL